MKGKRKKIIIAVIAVVVLIVAFRVVSALMKPKPQVGEVAVTVNTYDIKKESLSTYVTLSGKIKPQSEVNVIPKVAGKVSNIYVEIGQKINKGDLLFSIDKPDISFSVAQTQAAYNMAIEQNAQAKINFTTAESNLSRQQELFKVGGVSQMQLDSAQASYDVAKSQYEGTTAAAVQQAQAAYESALNSYNNTDVRSEIDGYVSSNSAVVGGMVSSASPVMTVVDIKNMYIEVAVPERVINKIDVQKEVDIEVASLNDKLYKGKIIGVSPSVNSLTQAYPVKVVIENGEEEIKGGMFASVKFTLETVNDTVVVPVSAVKEVSNNSVVYVVDEQNRAHKKTVKKGLSNDSFVQITEGLEVGQKVVTKGQDFLDEGSLVEIKTN
jgi:RND family efflux transporter MFP subunit